MIKYGSPEPASTVEVDENDRQGIDVTAAREQAKAEDYDPGAVIEEGEQQG